FIVADPATLNETAFRMPAHGERPALISLHPAVGRLLALGWGEGRAFAAPTRLRPRRRIKGQLVLSRPTGEGVRKTGEVLLRSRHPQPVDAAVNPVRQAANGRLVRVRSIEIFTGVKNPGEQEGGVDGRQLTFPGAQAGIYVEEMIEPAAAADDPIRLRTLRCVPKR